MKLPLPSLLLLPFLVACQSVPVPAPSGEEAAFVGVQIRTVRFESGETTYPNRAWWVRLEPDSTADPVRAGAVIESNYHRGQSVYLLNAEPGRYALVACGEERDGKVDYTFFPSECIRASLVEVAPGKGAFTGLLQVRRRLGLEPHREEMLHFSSLVNPAASHRSLLQSVFPRYRTYRVTEFEIDREGDRADSFNHYARKHLEEAGWSGRIE